MANRSQTIYGVHALEEALSSGTELQKVYILRDAPNTSYQHILNQCRQRDIPIQQVPSQNEIWRNKSHQGIAATVSPITYYELEMLIPQIYEKGETPFLILLDRVSDVRNFGAIARSAYCAGAHGIIIAQSGAAPVNEDAIKTSAGALMHIPVCREKNMKTVMELLNQSGIHTLACSEKGKDTIDQIDLNQPLAIIMGNEETGISTDILKRCSSLARIPMDQGVQSLNVSVAAGIILYETVRQRR